MRLLRIKENNKYELVESDPFNVYNPLSLSTCTSSIPVVVSMPTGSSSVSIYNNEDYLLPYHFPQKVESSGCKWCGIRLFPEDRWCPACGAPIFA